MNHIKQVEFAILENTDIVVCTLATLSDSRAERLQMAHPIVSLTKLDN